MLNGKQFNQIADNHNVFGFLCEDLMAAVLSQRPIKIAVILHSIIEIFDSHLFVNRMVNV